MATVLEIATRIKSDLDITGTERDSQIYDAIRSAELFYEGSPLWFLEAADTVTLLTSTNSVALPSNFASERRKGVRLLVNGVYHYDQNGFDRETWDDLETQYRANLQSNRPRHWAIYAGRLYVDTIADADYTISLSYYKKNATTLGTGDTGVFSVEGYDVIRSRAMAIFKDESLEYESAPADWARADRYYAQLLKTNTYRKTGA